MSPHKDMSQYINWEEIKVTHNWEEVHCLTMQGWKLIDIKGTGSVEAGYQEAYNPNPSATCPQCNTYHTCGSNGNENIQGSVVLTKALFILGLDDKHVTQGIRRELANAKSEAEKAKQEAHGSKSTETTANEQKQYAERALKEEYRISKNLGEKLGKMRMLEEDLAKVRKHVGEKTWKEITVGDRD